MILPDAVSVQPLIQNATSVQMEPILEAMRAIAAAGRGATAADEAALSGAARYLFGCRGQVNPTAFRAIAPDALAAALRVSNLAGDAAKFLTIMSPIDPPPDDNKMKRVLDYASELGVHQRYLDEMAEAARQHLQEALVDMTRANMASILKNKRRAGGVDAHGG